MNGESGESAVVAANTEQKRPGDYPPLAVLRGGGWRMRYRKVRSKWELVREIAFHHGWWMWEVQVEFMYTAGHKRTVALTSSGRCKTFRKAHAEVLRVSGELELQARVEAGVRDD